MNFQSMSDQAVLEELGERIHRCRLDNDISQEDVARRAGVGRNVVQNVENGKIYTIMGLIRILRALGLIGELDRLFSDLGPNPLELVKLKGHQRQRASGRRKERKGQ